MIDFREFCMVLLITFLIGSLGAFLLYSSNHSNYIQKDSYAQVMSKGYMVCVYQKQHQ